MIFAIAGGILLAVLVLKMIRLVPYILVGLVILYLIGAAHSQTLQTLPPTERYEIERAFGIHTPTTPSAKTPEIDLKKFDMCMAILKAWNGYNDIGQEIYCRKEARGTN